MGLELLRKLSPEARQHLMATFAATPELHQDAAEAQQIIKAILEGGPSARAPKHAYLLGFVEGFRPQWRLKARFANRTALEIDDLDQRGVRLYARAAQKVQITEDGRYPHPTRPSKPLDRAPMWRQEWPGNPKTFPAHRPKALRRADARAAA